MMDLDLVCTCKCEIEQHLKFLSVLCKKTKVYMLFPVQAYLWEDNKAVVDWLSEQLDQDRWEQSTLNENIRCLQRDFLLQQIRK